MPPVILGGLAAALLLASTAPALAAAPVKPPTSAQLRAALTVFAVLGLLVGPLPLLFAAMPDARRVEWAVLGFGLYVPLVLLARWYVRRAERNERDFVRLVEDR